MGLWPLGAKTAVRSVNFSMCAGSLACVGRDDQREFLRWRPRDGGWGALKRVCAASVDGQGGQLVWGWMHCDESRMNVGECPC